MSALPAASLAGRRIGLLTASASRLGGGVFEAVVRQAELIRSLGGEVEVFALADAVGAVDDARLGAQVRRFPVIGPRQVGYAPGLVRGMIDSRLDCLHLHGIWMYPSAAGACWARSTGRAYVVSPHGMLDPWITARGKAKKALARWGYERRSWRRTTAFHALTDSEAVDIRRETGRRETHVIPNAGPRHAEVGMRQPPGPRVVYVGRIHAKKNITALIEGWMAAIRPPGASLTIAGWGEEEALADMRAAMLGRADGSVEFVGPVFGEAKDALLDSARFVVLPSLSEGLPMAILEAWARRVPTIMSANCHLPVGFTTGAALECGTTHASIASALEQALGMDDARWLGMAAAAGTCAQDYFSPEVVAGRWADLYARACHQVQLAGKEPE